MAGIRRLTGEALGIDNLLEYVIQVPESSANVIPQVDMPKNKDSVSRAI